MSVFTTTDVRKTNGEPTLKIGICTNKHGGRSNDGIEVIRRLNGAPRLEAGICPNGNGGKIVVKFKEFRE